MEPGFLVGLAGAGVHVIDLLSTICMLTRSTRSSCPPRGNRGILGSVEQLYEMISLGIYGGLIAGTLIFQGLNSLYYFTRRKHVEAYLRETPQWVVELQRHGVAG